MAVIHYLVCSQMRHIEFNILGVLAHPIPEESGKRWSDAELAAQNPITALQIQKNWNNQLLRIRAR